MMWLVAKPKRLIKLVVCAALFYLTVATLKFVVRYPYVVRNSFTVLPAMVVAVKGSDITINSIVYATDFLGGGSTDYESLPIYPVRNHSVNVELVTAGSHSYTGYVNIYGWRDVCGESLWSLKSHPLFPLEPCYRDKKRSSYLQHLPSNTGVRVFGYLRAKASGSYKFTTSSPSGSTELWISSTADAENSTLACNGSNLVSAAFSLQKSTSYFFECIHKQHGSSGWLKIMWMTPHATSFELIQSEHLQMYIDDSRLFDGKVPLHDPHPVNLPQHRVHIPPSSLSLASLQLPFMDDAIVRSLFPICAYSPSYLVRHKLSRYGGVWETHYSSIYPSDNTNMTYKLKNADEQMIFGNDVLSKETAEKISNLVSSALEKKYPGAYHFFQILNVEENYVNPAEGKRYLVELEFVMKNGHGKHIKLSEYMYLEAGSETLCLPKEFHWNKSAIVNVILTAAGNQGRWIKHFINQMSNILTQTQDTNVNIIIVDFNNYDLDIKSALEASSIPRYVLLRKFGRFDKSEAIQVAAGVARDGYSIVLQVDLHITYPPNFFDSVRKHCVEGKMAYSPLVSRLQCGATPSHPFGFWEVNGYGIFGIYKSDWKKFGGMNIREFHNKWGGEDWEMLDRVLMAGYEVERLKIKDFHHIFHSKRGMWDNIV